MGISKFNKAIVIEGDSITKRIDSLYKLVHEYMEEKELKDRVLITLTQIAFCHYLLGIQVDENCRLASLISIVNEHYDVEYRLSDLHIHF
ncbi:MULTISPECIES: hypothetical protein [Priestia]|jgi:hypothetical protein|uniref:hypothetical protein n=1 Tax=Priestia TaxID=2800373 RepID=UPI002041BF3B|nr:MULTISPECIES: hypothetical protein [Priestia]MCM3768885.1 hypothetical protein [Priestia aryabhattai]MDY0942288.1 hypothetical protein [Priestia megaterium]